MESGVMKREKRLEGRIREKMGEIREGKGEEKKNDLSERERVLEGRMQEVRERLERERRGRNRKDIEEELILVREKSEREKYEGAGLLKGENERKGNDWILEGDGGVRKEENEGENGKKGKHRKEVKHGWARNKGDSKVYIF